MFRIDPVNLIFFSMSIIAVGNSTDFNRVAPDLYQGEWRIRLYYDIFLNPQECNSTYPAIKPMALLILSTFIANYLQKLVF